MSVNVEFIEGCFGKIDDDGNGTISMAELLEVFKAFDADGNGTISKEEFCGAFNVKFGGTAEQADRAFGKLDKDGGGDIDLSEIESFFKDMDKDGDDEITKPEFIEFWKQTDICVIQ